MNANEMLTKRAIPWNGIGTDITAATSIENALEMASMNWNVVSSDVYDANNNLIPGYKANIRDIDGSCLGIVSNKYEIVQNIEAFEFLDALMDEGLSFERAGLFRHGKAIWIQCKLNKFSILGDDYTQYVCFVNSHDGMGAIRAFVTPIRMICSNMLNVAIRNAASKWSIRHTGDIADKWYNISNVLNLSNLYADELNNIAQELIQVDISESQLIDIVENHIFTIPDNSSDRVANNIKQLRNEFYTRYLAPDLSEFRYTAWGVIQASADYASHHEPQRNTNAALDSRFETLLTGASVLSKTAQLLLPAA